MKPQNERFSDFQDVITSFDQVRDLMGKLIPSVRDKVIDRLDDVCRAFIEKAPFLVMASAGSDGHLDVSPKGDPVGFVQVLDDQRLAIPDRPGNRRADTFHNLLENPQVGLIFIIPGKTETLRVSGEARIVRDQNLREGMAVNGRVPDFALVVYVERVFMHCPKCMVRSNLWQPEAWPDHTNLANIVEAMIQHAKLDITPEELNKEGEKEDLLRLY